MITVVSWRWNDKRCLREFKPEYVNIHRAMVARHLKQPHRYICITDDSVGIDTETYPLWTDLRNLPNHVGTHLPSCFKRLKIFDGETTRAMGIADGDRVVSCDLDVVILNGLDILFDREEDFVGWRVPGGHHPSVFNGTIFMLRAGRYEHVWKKFQPSRSPQDARSAGYFGTDQGWLSYLLSKDAAGWTRKDGIISYQQDCRLTGALPPFARVVSFHGGKYHPWDERVQRDWPWVKQNWRL